MLVFKARPRRDPAQRAEITESQKRIMRTVMSAMDKVRAQVVSDEGKLLDLIAHSPIDKVINAVTVEPWLEMQPIIEAELLGELTDAGRRVKLPKIQKATLSYSFDAARPEAAAWASTEAGKLVVEIVESQRKVIRTMISDDTAGAKPPASIARDLRDVVGLTLEQSGWVRNHRQSEVARLIGENKTFDQAVSLADKSTERYQKRIHRYRTETIARTETLRASNEGRNEAWRQGVEEGFINPGASKQWSAELDGRVCEECAPLDGEIVKLNEEFSMGDPPVHPNCRCTVLLVDEIPADIASMTEEELDAEIESLLAGGAASEGIRAENFPNQPEFSDEFALNAKTFTGDDGIPWGNENFSEWQDKVFEDADTAIAVKGYTGSGYNTMNRALRRGEYDPSLPGGQRIQTLGKALDLPSATVPETIMGVRGLDLRDDDFGRLVRGLTPGDYLHEAGFTSIGLTDKLVLGYQEVTMRIKIPAGTKGAYLGKTSGYGDEEKELLLQAGTTFRVISVEDDLGGIEPKKYIDVEVVNQEFGAITMPPNIDVAKRLRYANFMDIEKQENEEVIENDPPATRAGKFVWSGGDIQIIKSSN